MLCNRFHKKSPMRISITSAEADMMMCQSVVVSGRPGGEQQRKKISQCTHKKLKKNTDRKII